MELLEQIKINFGNDFNCINIVRDWIGQVYEVRNNNNRYIAKIFRYEYTKQALQSIEIMNYLKNNNCSVPAIIKTLDKNNYFIYDNKIVVLYEYIEGEFVEKGVNLIDLGSKSAQMRKLMESYIGNIEPHGYDFFIKRYLDLLKTKKYHQTNQFTTLGNYLWERVKKLPNGFIHGDFHVGNMFYKENQIVLFDFDACAIASPAYDIATICDATDYFDLSEYNFENGFINTQQNVMKFLKGYEEYYQLSEYEKESIYDFIAIRHFDIQATIIESQGFDCVDEQFLNEQYIWLKRWICRAGSGV